MMHQRRNFLRGLFLRLFSSLSILVLLSCGGGGGSGTPTVGSGVSGPNVYGTPDDFRGAGIVNTSEFLIGGPLAQGRVGDVLLQNDQIRVIIQKPTRNTGVGLFGGNIIDADRFRSSSEPGQDQFGTTFPLINIGWTVNYRQLEIINADFANGPIILRATGILDVYDYIQTNIISPFSLINASAQLSYSERFDDVFDPFENIPELRDFSTVIVTDYILEPSTSYVRMETQLRNEGEDSIPIPFGDWLNGSGSLEPFIPQKGFSNTALAQKIPAFIYQGMEEHVGVSYGYFYDPISLIQEDGEIPSVDSLSISGVTPVILGDDVLKVLPPGSSGEPSISFTVDSGVRTMTRFFVVGDGDVASVMDSGFEALNVSKVRASGVVLDSQNNPVERARVVFFDGENPASMAFSEANGSFTADLSTGTDAKDKLFGSGSYSVEVYREGYLWQSGPRAGDCTGGNFDATTGTINGIACTLGDFATVSVTALENGVSIPARVTIVGFDPSPIHKLDVPEEFGKYQDIRLNQRPFGIVDVLYTDPAGFVHPTGNARVMGGNQFRLEPGKYQIFVTRGMEYSVYSQTINVVAGGNANVMANLQRVVDTSGFVSADLHLHGIRSADSAWSLESRVRAAMAEGMDVLVSTDHDYITDYAPVIAQLGFEGWLTSLAGDEITPLAFGHLLTFPLTPDPDSTTGGAYDYTLASSDSTPGPEHDLGQSISEIIAGIDADQEGTQVFQIAHILEKTTGNFSISGLVSSAAFEGVEPLSTYADPVRFRMLANTNSAGNFQAPFPLGTSGLFSLDFTSMEIVIGDDLASMEHLIESSLPTYFNMLNLGVLKTATGSSDTHDQILNPMGSPRNYIVSSEDPRDGLGTSFQNIAGEEIAVNTNAHKVIVSNGVFVVPTLLSQTDSQNVGVGGTISGTGSVSLQLEVLSNDYFDWDTVEVYANTVPIPAKDDLSGVTDLNAEDFHKITKDHLPKYLMSPVFTFSKSGSGTSALNQTVANGVRQAIVSTNFNFSQDTWIVVMVRGENSRSLFPYLTKGVDTTLDPITFLDTFKNTPDQIGGAPAWAFTNPIFVDVDANGFQALHVQDGKSPLAN